MTRIIARRRTILPFVVVALVCTAGVIWAANPHFIFVRSALQADGDVNVSFKEAGLGDNQLINYLAEADATVTCNCVTSRTWRTGPGLV